ncbi:MAG: metallophosphoesterase, partial [Chloroflexi bacterium]|nr:metallophosphoesterase [Chloroflexota bacterium]
TALISDIHGNDIALEAVLEDVRREHVDQVICLGDVATLGPQPREVIVRLKALGASCIMGNHDEFLLDPAAVHAYTTHPLVIETVGWCARQLDPADLDYVRSFRPLMSISLDANTTLLCFHGSPRSNTDAISPGTPDAELDALLEGQTATILAGGHTHLQMFRQHKGVMLVNPGSVGQPFAEVSAEGVPRLLPWAEYAIVGEQNGVLGVELRRVPVEMGTFKDIVAASDIPLREWLLRQYS